MKFTYFTLRAKSFFSYDDRVGPINKSHFVAQRPSYSPDLAPSDFRLFGPNKKTLRDLRVASDMYDKVAMQKWLHGLPKISYQEGVLKPVGLSGPSTLVKVGTICNIIYLLHTYLGLIKLQTSKLKSFLTYPRI